MHVENGLDKLPQATLAFDMQAGRESTISSHALVICGCSSEIC